MTPQEERTRMEGVRALLKRLEPGIPHSRGELCQSLPRLSDYAKGLIFDRLVEARILVFTMKRGARTIFTVRKGIDRSALKAIWEDNAKVSALAFPDADIDEVFKISRDDLTSRLLAGAREDMRSAPQFPPASDKAQLSLPPTIVHLPTPKVEESKEEPSPGSEDLLIKAVAALLTSQERMQSQINEVATKVADCHRMLTELMTPATPQKDPQ